MSRVPYRKGPKPAPKLPLDPAFITKIRNHQESVVRLAVAAGWSDGTPLYPMLVPGALVKITKQTVDRLQALAHQVHHPINRLFQGEARIFADGEVQVVADEVQS